MNGEHELLLPTVWQPRQPTKAASVFNEDVVDGCEQRRSADRTVPTRSRTKKPLRSFLATLFCTHGNHLLLEIPDRQEWRLPIRSRNCLHFTVSCGHAICVLAMLTGTDLSCDRRFAFRIGPNLGVYCSNYFILTV